jgi:hypothetical protein
MAMPVHDWARVDANLFHDFHHSADCRVMPTKPPGPLVSCAFGFSAVDGEAA